MSDENQTANFTPGDGSPMERAAVARKTEAAEMVAYHAEEFVDRLAKRWPEITDMDEWRDALMDAISELRML